MNMQERIEKIKDRDGRSMYFDASVGGNIEWYRAAVIDVLDWINRNEGQGMGALETYLRGLNYQNKHGI